ALPLAGSHSAVSNWATFFRLELEGRLRLGFVDFVERRGPQRARRGVNALGMHRIMALAGFAASATLGLSSAPAAALEASEVRIEAAGTAGVDEAAVRAAIERELARSATPGENSDASVTVRLQPDRLLTVVYRSPARGEVSRTVAAPGRTDEL